MLRRMYYKHAEIASHVHEILDHYATIEHKGIYVSDQQGANLAPSPPPGAPGRKSWKQQGVHGPISLLLQQMHYFAIAIHPTSHTLHYANNPPLHLFKAPYQLINPTIQGWAVNA
eukprot:9240814-Karenia_brevis.AAC.1